jgi:hypothetical protein
LRILTEQLALCRLAPADPISVGKLPYVGYP